MNEKMKSLRGSPVIRKLSVVPMPMFLLVAMVLVFSLISSKYFTVSNIMNIIVQCSSGIGIVALASFMAICSTGVDLSLGGVVSCTGMMAARILMTDSPFLNNLREQNMFLLILLAIAAALLLGALLGSLNGIILSKTNIPSFIVTLGTFKIGETLSRILAGGSTIRITNEAYAKIGGGSLITAEIGGRNIGLLPVSMIIMVVLYVIFTLVMRRRRFGTYVYAIGGNYEAATLSGINVDRTRFMVFLLNGLIAACVGIILSSRLTAASAANGLGLEFDGIAAAVVGGASMSGGKSTPVRTLIGAFIITAMKNGFNIVGMANSVQMITIGAVLIIIVAIDAARSRAKGA